MPPTTNVRTSLVRSFIRIAVPTALLTVVVLVACTKSQPPVPSANDPYLTAPTHTSFNPIVRFYDSTRTKAVLRSAKAYVYEQQQQTMLGGYVHVIFISVATGKNMATLRADSAVIDDRTKRMTAYGNVVVVSDSSKTRLQSPQLVWNSETERLSSSMDVEITTPKEHIIGKGFESDQFLTDFRIFEVRGTQR
jgi:LPS export ABC transporter protein LptC